MVTSTVEARRTTKIYFLAKQAHLLNRKCITMFLEIIEGLMNLKMKKTNNKDASKEVIKYKSRFGSKHFLTGYGYCFLVL